ncbi:MAG: helix-hairpin-helix domain-containing protein [Chloroflexota bacterium]
MTNAEICQIFREIADLLELKGENPYKIRAYRNIVRSIEELATPVSELVAEGRLREIPGAGEAISKKLNELVTTGHLEFYDKLKAEFPEGVRELLAIPGVGPKTAQMLYQDLGIKSLAELEKALTAGKPLPRMGEKTRGNILAGIGKTRREVR